MQNGFGIIMVVVDEEGSLKDGASIPRDQFESADDYYAQIAITQERLLSKYPEPPHRLYVGVADSLSTFLRSYPEINRPMSKV